MRTLLDTPGAIYSRKWARNKYNSNAAFRKRERRKQRKFQKLHPEKVALWERKKRLKRKFGITIEEYDSLLRKQSGVCAICGKPPRKYRLAVDHDHRTGKNRGLLCSPCNRWLGYVENHLQVLMGTLAYLRNHA